MDKAQDSGAALRASFDCRGPAVAGGSAPVTALLASCGQTMLALASWNVAEERGIRLIQDSVVAPALLMPSLQRHMPDVLLLGQEIYAGLDSRSLEQMRWRFPELRVLLLCKEPYRGLAEEVLRNGFHGFLLDGCSPDALSRAVRAVSRGELWLPRALLSAAILQLMQARPSGAVGTRDGRSQDDAGGVLTGRETQIVEFLRQGLTNKEIACRLGIMEDTVKKHLQGVFAKLGVRRRALVALDRIAPAD